MAAIGAVWGNVKSAISGSAPFGQATATATQTGPAPNANVGGQINQGTSDSSQASQALGFIIVNGEPAAVPGGVIVLSGARPGIDGTYGMTSVEHTYTRQGFITRVEVNNPRLGTYYTDQLGANQIVQASNTMSEAALAILPPLAANPPPDDQVSGGGE